MCLKWLFAEGSQKDVTKTERTRIKMGKPKKKKKIVYVNQVTKLNKNIKKNQ